MIKFFRISCKRDTRLLTALSCHLIPAPGEPRFLVLNFLPFGGLGPGDIGSEKRQKSLTFVFSVRGWVWVNLMEVEIPHSTQASAMPSFSATFSLESAFRRSGSFHATGACLFPQVEDCWILQMYFAQDQCLPHSKVP